MKKIHIVEISIAFALVFSVIVSTVSFGAECKKIRQDVVRLHILANSDSNEDQNIKLKIRDALLDCGSEIFAGELNVENAVEVINAEKSVLKELINEILSENGFDYKAEIYVEKEFFTTRQYDSFTLPAGEYLALKIILGNGEGHNWWCVMFPPLCLPAVTQENDIKYYLGKNGAEIIQNSPKYEVKFKIVEIFETIKCRIRQN